jgi:hypothetical protein
VRGSCIDGAIPFGDVIMDAAGNLYAPNFSGGTTGNGGGRRRREAG